MKTSPMKKLLGTLKSKKLTIAGITAAVVVLVFCAVTAFYYFTTPSATIIVTTVDFPTGLSTNFTMDQLTNYVEGHLNEIITRADSHEVPDTVVLEGLGPRAAKQTLIPIRALTNSPSPIFKLKWKGVDLNFCRTIGMSLKAKKFLELGVIGVPQGGWRLAASLKERPHFSGKSAGSAPLVGGPCTDFEKCADDLTEQILGSLDTQRLLKFYIKVRTAEANRRILALYQTMPEDTLQADDLIAWGNAFFSLNQYPPALEKYLAAINKDPNSCSAHVARGFVYYSRPGAGAQKLADLRLAERDFRKGISCEPRNEFTQTSLCHTLLRIWNNSKNPDIQLLVNAKEHCENALKINPQFVIGAVNLGYTLYRLGKHEDALRHFDELSLRHPTTSALFLNYGFLLYLEYLRDKSEERLIQATAQTRQSWDLDQKSDIAANNLGYFYYEKGDYSQALEFWKKANTLSAGDPDYIAGLALGTFKSGDKNEAVTLLSRAIQIDQHYRDPTYLKRNNNWSDQAAADLNILIRLIPR